MQPRGGRGGGPPLDTDLEERLRQTNISGHWQARVAFPGQFGTAYAVPYGLASAFQPQTRPGYGQAAQLQFPRSGPAIQYNQPGGIQYSQTPGLGSRPTSASPYRPSLQGPPSGLRPSALPFAAFYPQFAASYPVQFMPAAQWRPVPQQQGLAPLLPQAPGPRALFPAQGGQPFPPPRQQARHGGRQQQRGRHQRQYDPNRGQGQGQYRDMWQQVTQVSCCATSGACSSHVSTVHDMCSDCTNVNMSCDQGIA